MSPSCGVQVHRHKNQTWTRLGCLVSSVVWQQIQSGQFLVSSVLQSLLMLFLNICNSFPYTNFIWSSIWFSVPPSSHRQQLRDEQPVSHPEKTHHPAEGVRWSWTAVCPLLCCSLAILQHPAHCWKGEMWRQGGHRGWRGRWDRWRRRWWGGAGWGRGRGVVPLGGQGCRWLQCVVQTPRRVFVDLEKVWSCD